MRVSSCDAQKKDPQNAIKRANKSDQFDSELYSAVWKRARRRVANTS